MAPARVSRIIPPMGILGRSCCESDWHRMNSRTGFRRGNHKVLALGGDLGGTLRPVSPNYAQPLNNLATEEMGLWVNLADSRIISSRISEFQPQPTAEP
jgi:hypothetical protein